MFEFFKNIYSDVISYETDKMMLTLKASIATKVVCFSRLLKCLRSLCGKQCGPRSDCSYWSSLFWVHAVCLICQKYWQLHCICSRRLQQTTFSDVSFFCALRVKYNLALWRRLYLHLSHTNLSLFIISVEHLLCWRWQDPKSTKNMNSFTRL